MIELFGITLWVPGLVLAVTALGIAVILKQGKTK
jgi:hypothetical protein